MRQDRPESRHGQRVAHTEHIDGVRHKHGPRKEGTKASGQVGSAQELTWLRLPYPGSAHHMAVHTIIARCLLSPSLSLWPYYTMIVRFVE